MTNLPWPELVSWFHQNGRIFPWSATRDPYAIWISEVMLQQTVVNAVLDHYERWMKRWPDIRSLAAAEEGEVLRQWEGLGYYSRGRNVWKSARIVAERGGANLPTDYSTLRELPGFGDYTASAVLSFSSGAPFLTLDANLKRVFLRLHNQDLWSPELESRVRAPLTEIFQEHSSRDINQALMQLGQLVCLPRQPRCMGCPLVGVCEGKKEGRQNLIPLTTPKKVEVVQSSILVAATESHAFVARPVAGRFSNLWLFPTLPQAWTPDQPVSRKIPLRSRVHSYTRFKDHLTPEIFLWETPAALPPTIPLTPGWEGCWLEFAELERRGMPSVYRNIWEEALYYLGGKDSSPFPNGGNLLD